MNFFRRAIPFKEKMAGGAVFDIELPDQQYCESSGAASGRGMAVNGRSLRISDDDKEYSHIQEVINKFGFDYL